MSPYGTNLTNNQTQPSHPIPPKQQTYIICCFSSRHSVQLFIKRKQKKDKRAHRAAHHFLIMGVVDNIELGSIPKPTGPPKTKNVGLEAVGALRRPTEGEHVVLIARETNQ